MNQYVVTMALVSLGMFMRAAAIRSTNETLLGDPLFTVCGFVAAFAIWIVWSK